MNQSTINLAMTGTAVAGRVTAIRLAYNDDSEAWVHMVFAEPSNINALPDECRNAKWIADLLDAFMRNEIIVGAPVVAGAFAGLFWAEPIPSGAWDCHQFVMPRFRGWTAFRCAKAMCALFFREVTSATHLVGFTPITNRAALICAARAGFKACGIMPNYYTMNGTTHDCAIMVKERNNG